MKDSEFRANVLLVDDRADNLLALESCLADLGQNLLRARSATEALRFLLTEEVAVFRFDSDGSETSIYFVRNDTPKRRVGCL